MPQGRGVAVGTKKNFFAVHRSHPAVIKRIIIFVHFLSFSARAVKEKERALILEETKVKTAPVEKVVEVKAEEKPAVVFETPKPVEQPKERVERPQQNQKQLQIKTNF